MATFVPYNPFKGFSQLQIFTESCMRCFASVTYSKEETLQNLQTPEKYYIKCPNCDNEMTVNFQNIQLC